ncbi:MAG: hypothetical protein KAX65_14855, partial [Caldilineaceae bacterium]|nr:hypothetical protein [Caldilineaceae bacterium]
SASSSTGNNTTARSTVFILPPPQSLIGLPQASTSSACGSPDSVWTHLFVMTQTAAFSDGESKSGRTQVPWMNKTWAKLRQKSGPICLARIVRGFAEVHVEFVG